MDCRVFPRTTIQQIRKAYDDWIGVGTKVSFRLVYRSKVLHSWESVSRVAIGDDETMFMSEP